MSIIHAPDSAYAKEMTKFEAQGSIMGPGLRPYEKRDYPMMLHLAAVLPRGGMDIVDQQIVGDADHRARLERQGFRATPLEALEALATQQTEYATLAAERTYEAQRMSPGAQAEVVAAEDAAGAQHLPTIERTPIPTRGRPRKVGETEETR